MSIEDHVDLFGRPADDADGRPRLPDGRPPRGLTAGGWVRTTGWLQFGDWPVSSALMATLLGMLGAMVCAVLLVGTFPVAAGVLVVVVPPLFGAAWGILTTFVKPASLARNIGTKPAERLSPGDVVRLYGSIGPVGQVVAVTFAESVRVAFHGGGHRTWTRREVVHVAELLS
ncbi:hypothetical protein ABZ345_20470 [Lentzea sp. NPDC005914]|uniref:hypothetical protein n=1 Tax=Lentzea sp. NPDC005914 TaxID=3154572 RepID=UPI0033FAFCD6